MRLYLFLLSIFVIGCNSILPDTLNLLNRAAPLVRIKVELLGEPINLPGEPGAVQVLAQGDFDKNVAGLETVWLECPAGEADKCTKGSGANIVVVNPEERGHTRSLNLNTNEEVYRPVYRAQKVN